MRKILYMFLSASLLVTSSCTKWLDVQPKTEIKSENMFETEQGFKDAIIGCYILMSHEDIYGFELTAGLMEILGQQYELSSYIDEEYYYASSYNYKFDDDIMEMTDNLWFKLYNVIANVNNIIGQIDDKKDVLHSTNYAMIKAEAYALRAFLYTDLIRLYSFGDLANRPEKLKELAIPYVTIYDKNTTKQHTLQEVIDFIFSDVNTALEIFHLYDPWSNPTERPENYYVPNEDGFYDDDNRGYRMNIKAAYAIRARLNMWLGNYEEVLKDTDILIDEIDTEWINANTYLSPESNVNWDLTFSKEQIFGVETFERFEDHIVPNFHKYTEVNGSSENRYMLYVDNEVIDELFEKNQEGLSDYRYLMLFDKTNEEYEMIKYWEEERMNFKNNMPLIRKSEIYYMAIEAYIEYENNIERAVELMNEVRSARGVSSNYNLASDITAEELTAELVAEWRKEYIGDGQIFYFYKRLGYQTIPNSSAVMSDIAYILPMPEYEVDFGGRLEPELE